MPSSEYQIVITATSEDEDKKRKSTGINTELTNASQKAKPNEETQVNQPPVKQEEDEDDVVEVIDLYSSDEDEESTVAAKSKKEEVVVAAKSCNEINVGQKMSSAGNSYLRPGSLTSVECQQVALLEHASLCSSSNCQSLDCKKMKSLLQHNEICPVKASGGCNNCFFISKILRNHSQQCRLTNCPIPQCMSMNRINSNSMSLAASSSSSLSGSSSLSEHTAPPPSTRNPFFQLYDDITGNLESARQRNDSASMEFYRHLRDFFVRKIEEDGFDASSFVSSPIKQSILCFENAVKRLANAKLNHQAANVMMYTYELKSITNDCKKQLPLPVVNTKLPIKLEDDDEDSLF